MEITIDLDEFRLEGVARQSAWESAMKFMRIVAEVVADDPEFFDHSARGRATLKMMDYVSTMICQFIVHKVIPDE